MGCGVSSGRKHKRPYVAVLTSGVLVHDGRTWQNTGSMTADRALVASENATMYDAYRFPEREEASPEYKGDAYGEGVVYDCARKPFGRLLSPHLSPCSSARSQPETLVHARSFACMPQNPRLSAAPPAGTRHLAAVQGTFIIASGHFTRLRGRPTSSRTCSSALWWRRVLSSSTTFRWCAPVPKRTHAAARSSDCALERLRVRGLHFWIRRARLRRAGSAAVGALRRAGPVPTSARLKQRLAAGCAWLLSALLLSLPASCARRVCAPRCARGSCRPARGMVSRVRAPLLCNGFFGVALEGSWARALQPASSRATHPAHPHRPLPRHARRSWWR